MKRLIGWLVAAFVPAAIGAAFPSPEYYRGLRKPAWAPPGWVFGPVWTFLYALIGIAAWIVARRGGPGRTPALRLWAGQLVLNAAWTPIFFGLRARGLALVEIVALWAAVVATTVSFFARSNAAGALMVPYQAWVSFATALTWEVWRRNR